MNRTKEPVVLLTVDYAFQYVMRNEEILKSLLAAVLKVRPDEIEGIRYLPRDLDKVKEDDKLGILDLHLLMKNEYEINIELQMRKMKYWENRTSFYIFKMFVDQMKSGGIYKVNPCIGINILGFDFKPGRKKFHSKYMFMETETGDIYTDKIALHVLELPKLKYASEEEKNSDLYLWAKLFKARSWDEYEELAGENEGIRKAVDKMREITADEIKQKEYLHHFLAERDREYELESAVEEGEIKGKIKGKADDIIMLLEDLGEIPEAIRARIYSETNLDVMKKWLRLAASADNISEFEAALENCK